jgi:hypothetical protein
MTYEEWLASVPAEFTQDPLWRMEVYRLAVFASDLAWRDVSRLAKDRRTVSLVNQIIRLLLTIIPAERGHKLREEPTPYDVDVTDLLDNPPMP